jgi:4-oxalocrotonate tautomerase
MPHISVKLYPGRTEEQKKAFARRVVEAAEEELEASSAHISVAIQEVAPEDWEEAVYKPEVLANEKYLYKKLG